MPNTMEDRKTKPVKAVDLDAAFDKKVGEYFKSKKNKGKYSEEEWEDEVAALYIRFADSYIARLNATPNEYYEQMSPEQIAILLKEHFAKGVAIDSFFRRALQKEENRAVVLPLLEGTDDEIELALEILEFDRALLPTYLRILDCGDGVSIAQNEIYDLLRYYADEVADELIKSYGEGKATWAIPDILSCCKKRTDEIFQILLNEFLNTNDLEWGAPLLSRYGDERALPYILARASEEKSFINWRAMRLAVEGLGGRLPSRDFSSDKDYQAIERAKTAESQEVTADVEGKN